jgi:hypothetical protein
MVSNITFTLGYIYGKNGNFIFLSVATGLKQKLCVIQAQNLSV